jgi:hypothetical protein
MAVPRPAMYCDIVRVPLPDTQVGRPTGATPLPGRTARCPPQCDLPSVGKGTRGPPEPAVPDGRPGAKTAPPQIMRSPPCPTAIHITSRTGGTLDLHPDGVKSNSPARPPARSRCAERSPRCLPLGPLLRCGDDSDAVTTGPGDHDCAGARTGATPAPGGSRPETPSRRTAREGRCQADPPRGRRRLPRAAGPARRHLVAGRWRRTRSTTPVRAGMRRTLGPARCWSPWVTVGRAGRSHQCARFPSTARAVAGGGPRPAAAPARARAGAVVPASGPG